MLTKSTLTTLILLGNVITNPLFASNFFHQLMPSKKPAQHLQTKVPAKYKNDNYTDFSGNWAGNCTIAGHDIPFSTSIGNDNTYLEIDGERFQIGSLHTQTVSDSFSEKLEHTSVEWSNDMSMLVMKSQSFDKVHPSYPYNNSSPMETAIGQITLSLNGEQLVIKGEGIYLLDMEQVSDENEVTCTLNKE
jgi:hypothetical protein